MGKTVGDIIKALEKYPKDMIFVAEIRGTFSEQFDFRKKSLALNVENYDWYSGEHLEYNEEQIEDYKPEMQNVIALVFNEPKSK
jgi:hypothetical protein